MRIYCTRVNERERERVRRKGKTVEEGKYGGGGGGWCEVISSTLSKPGVQTSNYHG